MNKIELPVDGTLTEDIVCFHNRDSLHDSPFHQHSSHFELYLFLAGNVTFYTDKAAYAMKPGYLVAIPPGQWHRSATNDAAPYERIFINIKKDLVATLSTPQTDLAACFYMAHPKDLIILKLNEAELTQFIALSHELIATLGAQTYGDDIRQRALLARILLLANVANNVVKQEQQNIIPSQLQQILSFIDGNLAGDLSLAAFSNHFYLNATYLNRYFKSYMGLSLHRYIIEKRLELAKQLLLAGHSVSNVCEDCGFGNYSNFIRAFKKYVGISPGKYQR